MTAISQQLVRWNYLCKIAMLLCKSIKSGCIEKMKPINCIYVLKEGEQSMKLVLKEDKNLKETLVTITYNLFDRHTQEIVNRVRGHTIQLEGIRDGAVHFIDSKEVYYIESVDNTLFLYAHTDIYQCKEKLYTIEKKLSKRSFVRINKSTILNMDMLERVLPLPNYRLEAKLRNGEHVIINRHYVKDIKNYLEI